MLHDRFHYDVLLKGCPMSKPTRVVVSAVAGIAGVAATVAFLKITGNAPSNAATGAIGLLAVVGTWLLTDPHPH